MKLEKHLASRMYGYMTDGFCIKITMMGEREKSITNRIYFKALMVTIKMRRKIRFYIFCCLNFLLFSLRTSKNCIFIFDKFCTFGNAPLRLKIICKTLLILFLFCNLLFLFIHSKLLSSKILLLKKTISVNDY